MSNFRIINDINKLDLGNKWVDAKKFNCKDRIVDKKGRALDPEALQPGVDRYRIISKKECIFTGCQRAKRGFLGTMVIMGTLGIGLKSQRVRNLFKKKLTSRYAVLLENTKTGLQDGKLVYINPKKCFNYNGTGGLNFVIIKSDGKEKLLPVVNVVSDKFRLYEGNPTEALLKMIQNQYANESLSQFLKNPLNNLINEDEFFKLILDKDGKGKLLICNLNSEMTLSVLQLIKEKNIPFNLDAKDREFLFKSLLIKSSLHEEKCSQIIQLLFELDPLMVELVRSMPRSLFVQSALLGNSKLAKVILEAFNQHQIKLTEEEIWVKRIVDGDLSFSDKEFDELSDKTKNAVFYAANRVFNEPLVKRLKALLGAEEKLLFTPGADIFAENMDIVQTREVMGDFLQDLRKNGRLLTQVEFSKLEMKSLSKSNDIGRILGRNFIEKIAQEMGLKHIKVPKKIVVVKPGVTSLKFNFDQRGEMGIKDEAITIFAELIEPVKRKISLEEAIEFMIVVEKTGYNDFIGENYFFAADGIYFIDTEFHNFTPDTPKFETIKSIEALLNDPADKKKFLEVYEERKKNFDEDQDRIAKKKAYKEYFEKPYKNLRSGYRENNFVFSLDSLMNI